MSDEKGMPYIKRLEMQRDALIETLKALEAYHAAEERLKNTTYKADAQKQANAAYAKFQTAMSNAKSILGGLYV